MTKEGRIERDVRNKLRNQFLFGRVSKSFLARQYHIDRGTIARWAEEEGWEELRHMILGTQALAKLRPLDAQGSTSAPETSSDDEAPTAPDTDSPFSWNF